MEKAPNIKYTRDDLSRVARSVLSLSRGRTKRASSVALGKVVFDSAEGRIEAGAVGTAPKDGSPPTWSPWLDQYGWGCDCPDSSYRSGACKHLAALALHTLTSAAWKGFDEARPALLAIRRKAASSGVTEGFDEDVLRIAKELAHGRNIEPWDFVRAAREVSLTRGLPI
jgi:hypothetical protein